MRWTNQLFRKGLGGLPEIIEDVLVVSGDKRPVVGMIGPRSVSISRLSEDPDTHISKISNAWPVLYRLLSGETQYAAVDTWDVDKNVYVERQNYGEVENSIIFNGETLLSTDTVTVEDFIVIIFAYAKAAANHGEDDWSEIKEKIETISRDIRDTGKTDVKNVLILCDSVYLCVPKHIGHTIPTSSTGVEVAEDMTLTKESIKQLGRSLSDPEDAIIDFGRFDEATIRPINMDIKASEKKTEKKKKTEVKPIMERIMDGDFIVPYPWSDEDKNFIPSMSFFDSYIPTEDFESCLSVMSYNIGKILENVDRGLSGAEAIGNYGEGFTFIGKPGTGKSTMGKAVAAALQIPFYPCTTTKFSEEDQYQGKTKLGKGDGKVAFEFKETPFLKAFQNGGLVMIEEFNIADPGMLMGALGQAIEKPFILEKDGYEPIVKHPLCFIVFTCNVGTQGSAAPNEALLSRAPHVFDVEDPKENEFIDILVKQTGAEKDVVSKVFRVYKKIQDYLIEQNQPDMAAVVTLRHCMAAIKQVCAGQSIQKATARAFVNPLRIFDKDLAEDVFSGCIETLK